VPGPDDPGMVLGEVEMFGTQYAMRIWLDPDKLTNYQLTLEDVITALRAYNVEVSAGQFGGIPAVKGQQLNASVVVQSLLKTPEEFSAIPLRINPDGSIVRIKDVGRAELGTEFYDVEVNYSGRPSTALAIRMDSPGPVFYRQTRIGKGGGPFTLFKFRSMCSNAEEQDGGFLGPGDLVLVHKLRIFPFFVDPFFDNPYHLRRILLDQLCGLLPEIKGFALPRHFGGKCGRLGRGHLRQVGSLFFREGNPFLEERSDHKEDEQDGQD
jgi:hypothetical protein